MLVAHVSDSHLGLSRGTKVDLETGRNWRQVDMERGYAAAVRAAQDAGADLLIHSGDAFHMVRPTYAPIRSFIESTRQFQGPSVCVGGNHDTSRTRSAISVFSVVEPALPDFYVASGWDEKWIWTPEADVFLVPWGRLMSDREYGRWPDFEDERPKILVAHGDVPGGAFVDSEPGNGAVPLKLLMQPWDYVAIGHIHLHQQILGLNAWYAGPTERSGWSDETAVPGLLLVEVRRGEKPLVRHVPVPHRRFLDLGVFDATDIAHEEVIVRFDRWVGERCEPEDVVKVTLRGASRAVVSRARRHMLRTDLATEVQVLSEDEAADPVKTLMAIKPEAFEPLRMFSEFVASQDYDPEFRAKFGNAGNLALEAAIREAEQDPV